MATCEWYDLPCFINSLWNMMYEFLYSFIKPFYDILNLIITSFVNSINYLIGVIVEIYGLTSSVILFIYNTFGLLFGYEITNLITIGVTIIVALRVYYFVKDISIAGFKI